jgi:hypothetical protein
MRLVGRDSLQGLHRRSRLSRPTDGHAGANADRFSSSCQLTLHAIKATRDQIRFGMTEFEVRGLLGENFKRVGMKADGLILFGGQSFQFQINSPRVPGLTLSPRL